MIWHNGKDIYVDGLVDVSGTNGLGSNAGGGSGGSIRIRTLNISGNIHSNTFLT